RVVLMTGYGYDPTHALVKARQEGLRYVLYKPFRVDQLMQVLAEPEPASNKDGRGARSIHRSSLPTSRTPRTGHGRTRASRTPLRLCRRGPGPPGAARRQPQLVVRPAAAPKGRRRDPPGPRRRLRRRAGGALPAVRRLRPAPAVRAGLRRAGAGVG